MALSKKELKELAQGLIENMPPQPVEIVGITGEMFSVEALALARVYDSATNAQRAAIDEITRAFRTAKPGGGRDG